MTWMSEERNPILAKREAKAKEDRWREAECLWLHIIRGQGAKNWGVDRAVLDVEADRPASVAELLG